MKSLISVTTALLATFSLSNASNSCSENAVGVVSSQNGSSENEVGNYGIILNGVFDECEIETQKLGVDFTDVIMAIQDDGQTALSITGLAEVRTVTAAANSTHFGYFYINVVIPGNFELVEGDYIVGQSFDNMEYIGAMTQVLESGESMDNPIVIEMRTKAASEGTYSFRCLAEDSDPNCNGWIMHRVAETGSLPNNCKSCEYENHPYSDFRFVQNQECKSNPNPEPEIERCCSEAVEVVSSENGSSIGEVGNYGIILNGVFDECDIETQKLGVDFTDVIMAVQNDGQALSITGFAEVRTVNETTNNIHFGYFNINVLIPGEFKLVAGNFIVGESFHNMEYIGAMTQVQESGESLDNPIVIEMLTKAASEGTYSFRCLPENNDPNCNGWIMHRVTESGSLPAECTSCDYENHQYSDFRFVQTQQCRDPQDPLAIRQLDCVEPVEELPCPDFDITINGLSPTEDSEADYDYSYSISDSIGFVALNIVSNHDTTLDFRFLNNDAKLYVSECSLAVEEKESFLVTITSDLNRGRGCTPSSIIKLSFGETKECVKKIRIERTGLQKGTCSSAGDPHTRTLDKGKHDWGNYDYATIFKGCDLNILGHHNFTQKTVQKTLTDSTEIEKTPVVVSTYQGIKFQYKRSIVSIVSNLDNNHVDEQDIYADVLSGAEMEDIAYFKSKGKHVFILPDGSKISIKSRLAKNGNGYVMDLKLALSARYKELCSEITSITGVCGNWNGDKSDDGYTLENVSPNGPWHSLTFQADENLPVTSFPANVNRFRCDGNDVTKVFIDTFPNSPSAPSRRSSETDSATSTVNNDSTGDDTMAYEVALSICSKGAADFPNIDFDGIEECLNATQEVEACAMDLSLGLGADALLQIVESFTDCPAFEQALDNAIENFNPNRRRNEDVSSKDTNILLLQRILEVHDCNHQGSFDVALGKCICNDGFHGTQCDILDSTKTQAGILRFHGSCLNLDALSERERKVTVTISAHEDSDEFSVVGKSNGRSVFLNTALEGDLVTFIVASNLDVIDKSVRVTLKENAKRIVQTFDISIC